jgi:hypothetical protein
VLARRTVVLADGRQRHFMKGMHSPSCRYDETEVCAIASGGRFAIGRYLHPELGKLLAIGNRAEVLHDALAT